MKKNWANVPEREKWKDTHGAGEVRISEQIRLWRLRRSWERGPIKKEYDRIYLRFGSHKDIRKPRSLIIGFRLLNIVFWLEFRGPTIHFVQGSFSSINQSKNKESTTPPKARSGATKIFLVGTCLLLISQKKEVDLSEVASQILLAFYLINEESLSSDSSSGMNESYSIPCSLRTFSQILWLYSLIQSRLKCLIFSYGFRSFFDKEFASPLSFLTSVEFNEPFTSPLFGVVRRTQKSI